MRTKKTRLKMTNSIRKNRFNMNEMTQAELAKKLGVTRQTILLIEAGRNCPSLELAHKIATFFGKRIDEVFSFSEPDEKAGSSKK